MILERQATATVGSENMNLSAKVSIKMTDYSFIHGFLHNINEYLFVFTKIDTQKLNYCSKPIFIYF